MRASAFVGFACVAVIATGCGSGNDNFDFIDSYCSEIASCCAQARRSGDGSNCRRDLQLMVAASTYNASAASACMAELKAEVAAGACAGHSSYLPWPCQLVYSIEFAHTKKPGETCDPLHNCAPSNDGLVRCEGILNGDYGQCQLWVLGKKGDTPCVGTFKNSTVDEYKAANSTDIVPRAYVCDGTKNLTCANGTCVSAAVAPGTSCKDDSGCGPSGYCSIPELVCAPKIAIGESCKGKNIYCVDNAYCDTATNQCASALATGSACSETSACQSGYCGTGNVCKGYSILLSNYCGL